MTMALAARTPGRYWPRELQERIGRFLAPDWSRYSDIDGSLDFARDLGGGFAARLGMAYHPVGLITTGRQPMVSMGVKILASNQLGHEYHFPDRSMRVLADDINSGFRERVNDLVQEAQLTYLTHG